MLKFLVNPASSSGNGKKIWNQAEQYLLSNHVKYRCLFLKEPGDAGRIAHSLTSGTKRSVIVIVGGDGTVNECINGISDFHNCILGFIPAGSANDLALTLGLPSDPLKILKMILSPKKVCSLNIGQVGIESEDGADNKKTSTSLSRFVVSSGIGYDAAICYESSQSSLKQFVNRIHAGKLSYTLTALKMLYAMKPMRLSVITDGRNLYSYENVYFVCAMNSRSEGGGYPFCPKADPTDDILDLMIVEGLRKPFVLLGMPAAKLGLHTILKGIHILRCSRATVCVSRKDPPACVHMDGEHAGFSRKIVWSLSEERLKMIVG